ncbi:MAG: hypothetical protein ISS45_02745 [Candidatus Omnitrophica bacterium]|nr:hypothetical protein [Candidatus Omnitrophota bacterium]
MAYAQISADEKIQDDHRCRRKYLCSSVSSNLCSSVKSCLYLIDKALCYILMLSDTIKPAIAVIFFLIIVPPLAYVLARSRQSKMKAG